MLIFYDFKRNEFKRLIFSPRFLFSILTVRLLFTCSLDNRCLPCIGFFCRFEEPMAVTLIRTPLFGCGCQPAPIPGYPRFTIYSHVNRFPFPFTLVLPRP